MTVPGHFVGFGLVREHLLRSEPVPVQFGSAGALFGDFARSGSLLAHFERAGPVGAFARAGSAIGHLLRADLGHLVRAVLGLLAGAALGRLVRAARRPVHLPRPPKPGIDLSRAPLVPGGFRPEPQFDRQF